MTKIASLMYHEISNEKDNAHKYTISVEEFEKQLVYLRNNEFKTPSVEELINGELNHSSTKNSVILTFDDGYESDYSIALSNLLKFGYKAIFFITTGFIKSNNYLQPQQIREISHNMPIGSHTHSHQFLDDLNSDEIYEELQSSKHILEDILEKPVELLSCPGGRYDSRVIKIAAKIGYRAIFTSTPKSWIRSEEIPILGRFLIDSSTHLNTYRDIVYQKYTYLFRKQFEYKLKKLAKKTIGNYLYYKIWKKLKTKSPREPQA